MDETFIGVAPQISVLEVLFVIVVSIGIGIFLKWAVYDGRRI